MKYPQLNSDDHTLIIYALRCLRQQNIEEIKRLESLGGNITLPKEDAEKVIQNVNKILDKYKID